ncbi:hypothetical protein HDV00_001639 [Rhizophlyctis rosea]|nr:hypothetical protein HDV00_001639 [Rhizophlyctis rosea]
MATADTTTGEAQQAPSPTFRVVAGAYERILYGLDVTPTPATITPAFMYPAHISCIKSLSTSPRYLATGSTDETVKLYDLRLRKEIGSLMHHNGTVTCLKFYKTSHLVTASEDGTIAIVRTRDWEVLKTMTGHKRAVNWVDVHPSGKVMLSVGRDGTIKCWDLVKGLCAYSMKLPKIADRVCWSPSGNFHAVLLDGGAVQIHTTADGEVVGKVEGVGKVNCITFTSLTIPSEDGTSEKEVVVTGDEDRSVGVWNTDGTKIMRFMTPHGNRIKDLDAISLPTTPSPQTFLVTCASDGSINVWDLASVYTHLASLPPPPPPTVPAQPTKFPKPIPPPAATPLTTYDAKCRLTCLAIAPPESTRGGRPLPSANDDKEGLEGASDWESEYEEPAGAGRNGVGKREKPVVSVSFEGGANGGGAAGKKKKIKKKKKGEKAAGGDVKAGQKRKAEEEGEGREDVGEEEEKEEVVEPVKSTPVKSPSQPKSKPKSILKKPVKKAGTTPVKAAKKQRK